MSQCRPAGEQQGTYQHVVSTAVLAVVISGAVEHVREVDGGPGTPLARGNLGVALSHFSAGGGAHGRGCSWGDSGRLCSRGGGGSGGRAGSCRAAMFLIFTRSVSAVHQLWIVAVVVSDVKQEVLLTLRE